MTAENTEDVSVLPVVAAAVQVSENQETRDAANEATERAVAAQAEAQVAEDTAEQATENSAAVGEVALVSAEIGTSAAISAEEAKQEAGEAKSEIAQLREDLFSRLDEMRNILQPPEPEPTDNGVKEVVLDGTDIGESGLESSSGGEGETPVSGDNSGSESAGSSGNSGSRSRGFKRGRR